MFGQAKHETKTPKHSARKKRTIAETIEREREGDRTSKKTQHRHTHTKRRHTGKTQS